MVKNISKEEIFNYLAAEEIFPGTNGHEKAVRETIYFLLGTSEGKSPNDLVDKVCRVSQIYHDVLQGTASVQAFALVVRDSASL